MSRLASSPDAAHLAAVAAVAANVTHSQQPSHPGSQAKIGQGVHQVTEVSHVATRVVALALARCYLNDGLLMNVTLSLKAKATRCRRVSYASSKYCCSSCGHVISSELQLVPEPSMIDRAISLPEMPVEIRAMVLEHFPSC